MSNTQLMAELNKMTSPAAQVRVSPVDASKQREEKRGPKWLPEGIRNVWGGISRFNTRARNASIQATPTFIVNNSSNVLGASHVATEMLMIKSGMKGAKLIDHPENPINWVWEPIQKVYGDIIPRTPDFSIVDLFRGNPVHNFKHYIMDTHSASLREVERQIVSNEKLLAVGKQAKKLSLGNPWQTRTTGTGLAIWTISALLPEKKESDEEIERMAKMRTLHPVRYVGERFKQALWLPEWGKHKREMLGLGYLGIGVLSGLGSWRQRGKLDPTVIEDAQLIAKGLEKGYRFSVGYFITSVISFIGGLPLLFALDERKAYSTYGSMVLLRVPTLFQSLHEKFAINEDGKWPYLIGKVTFQIEDIAFMLIGGATKRKNPDGTTTIVDHEALKKNAIFEAKEEKLQIKEAKLREDVKPREEDNPTTTVASVSMREHAMPERLVANQQSQQAETAHSAAV